MTERTYTCSQCQRQKTVKPDRRGDFRLPNEGPKNGFWKTIENRVWCCTCFKAQYIARSVSLPVHCPPEDCGSPEQSSAERWRLFRAQLRPAFLESTCLANWAVQELFRRDTVRSSDMESPPPAPNVYLYGLLGAYPGRASWTGAMSAVQCLLRDVQRRYQRQRREVFYHRDNSVLTHCYPFPIPIDADSWDAAIDADGTASVSLKLPGGNRITVELTSHKSLFRQVAGLQSLIDNPDLCGEAKVCLVGPRTKKQIVVRFAGYFPRRERTSGDRNRVLTVRTDAQSFWVATVDGRREPFVLNADHIKRRVAVHTSYRQRMSEDTKHEKRWPKHMKEQILHNLEKRCEKQHNRLRAWTHEASAMIVGFAIRQGVARLDYCDDCKDFLKDRSGEYLPFPWHELREKLAYKCQAANIEYHYHGTPDASGEVLN